MKSIKLLLMGLFSMAFLYACGGSSSVTEEGVGETEEETVLSYNIPSQLVLVGNNDDVVSASLSQTHFFAALGDATITDDDFANDDVSEYIYDGTGDYLEIINQIFCAVGQTKYANAAVMDQGPQIVLINTSKCASDYFYQTSGSNSADSYEEWIVDARTNEDGTATVYFRIKGNANSEGSLGFWYETIDGQIDITEGVSEDNQIGTFELNATGYYEDEVVFNTTLASLPRDDGFVQLQFLMEYPSDSFSFSSGVNAILDPSGAEGQAIVNYTSTFDSGGGSAVADGTGDFAEGASETYVTTMQINFDESHVRTDFNADDWEFEQCVDRTDKNETFVSYNLYSENSEGGLDRLDLNTGMGFKTENDFWGFASTWGVYAGETLADGDVVTGDDGESYTVTVGEGMLMAAIKEEQSFDLMTGKEIYDYDSETFDSYIMAWNGSAFMKTKVFSCNEDGYCDYFSVTQEEVELSVGSHNYWVNGVGSVDFIVPEAGLSASSTLYVSSYQNITPTDSRVQNGLSLKCFYSCPKGGLTQEDVDANTVFYEDDEIHYYTLDTDTFDLIEENDGSVAVGSDLDMESSYYAWGYTSGPMVRASSSINSSAQVNNANVIYTWQVGTNEWNRYTGLVDAEGEAVAFDNPISCTYENDEGTFILEYYDLGQLFGIPYVSDTDNDTGFTTYSSQFRIPDRDTMECDGETYATKAVFIQYDMSTVENSDCADLDVSPLELADLEFAAPELPDMTPEGDAPVVIGGIVQEE